ncbi:MAG: hypothetical protein SNJ72_00720 [Fimbriimonadales bacterium]
MRPTLIGYRRGMEVVPVTTTNALPVVAPPAIEPLFWGSATPNTASTPAPHHADLSGSTNPEIPTLVNMGMYHSLVWTGWKSSGVDVSYAVYGRATDPNGLPLHTSGTAVWALVQQGVITTGASAGYFRVMIRASDGGPLGYDHYRIVLCASSSPPSVLSQIKGLR